MLTSNQEGYSKHQKRNLSRRLIIIITVCNHHDTTVVDYKGHKSWLPTQERRMQDQLPARYGDLKLYGKNSSQIDSLVQTVWSCSEDIGMKFGIDKCAVLELERGRLVKSEGIEFPDGERMKEVDQEGYMYLAVLQLDKTINKEMKENIGNEYIRKVKLI